MMYKYLGKEVIVVRFSNNDTAQLADGTWIPSAMLVPQSSNNAEQRLSQSSKAKSIPADTFAKDSALETATKRRQKASESN